ncbi:uncharacterized protein G2W53_031806 [Senna tora]|uniref:Uncharacterized protein n=1 Tax=Senna tora TaxID=362788 RepID=A0A834W5S5_9FABA|nr:uncharacterized protein G2W53_031806 [Senna tora]
MAPKCDRAGRVDRVTGLVYTPRPQRRIEIKKNPTYR